MGERIGSRVSSLSSIEEFNLHHVAAREQASPKPKNYKPFFCLFLDRIKHLAVASVTCVYLIISRFIWQLFIISTEKLIIVAERLFEDLHNKLIDYPPRVAATANEEPAQERRYTLRIRNRPDRLQYT